MKIINKPYKKLTLLFLNANIYARAWSREMYVLLLLKMYSLKIFETCWGFFQPDWKKEDPEVLFDSEPGLFFDCSSYATIGNVTAGNSGLYRAHYTFFSQQQSELEKKLSKKLNIKKHGVPHLISINFFS